MRLTKRRTYRQVYKSNTPGEHVPLTPEEEAELMQALARTQARMGPFFLGHQYLGRQATIGCVALEVTQRCNLDCSLCYLSPNSQRVQDLPLQEVMRRLEQIRRHFGVGTVVQITGGDPTLRERRELVAIVRRARQLGLPPALFTNGIKASRSLLSELAEAGLNDVAFHVDLTQKRKGFSSEIALNALRAEYSERGRGLPINVMFNTTVYDGNLADIPAVVQWFIQHADVVSMASFQLQADTGRGALRKRAPVVSLESVRACIDRGAGRTLPWDAVLIGHPQCHNYVLTLAVHGRLYPLLPDQDFYSRYLRDFSIDRRAPRSAVIWRYLRAARRHPRWYWRALGYGLRQAWHMKHDLLAARGRVHKLSFFIHNFMDAQGLDPERLHACSFMVMTADGPLSMCAHNARRDDFILAPLEIETAQGKTRWLPLREDHKPGPTSAGHSAGTCGGCQA
jgi:hypothetical protein